jgi:hypothetical protein
VAGFPAGSTKFSQHAVDVGMKEELREAAAAREEARRVELQATEAST